MLLHAWNGYKRYAWGSDELNPLTQQGHNWTTTGSMLFTPVDAMDTLYIAGLSNEFSEAKELVAASMDFNVNDSSNVFETTIRVLGGLLAAFDLDGDHRILKKAILLGDKLLNVFNSQSGIPDQLIVLASGQTYHGAVSLATAGTLQLEFQYLSDVSGDPKYADAALHVLEIIRRLESVKYKGLYPIDVNYSSDSKFGIGAEADSFYEYLLKLWISTGDARYRDWYDESALSCFAGGMFAMGAMTKADENSKRLLGVAAKLTGTCYNSYQINPTGLGSEWTRVDENGNLVISDPSYLLRPELVESIFYMWRYTHDAKYREWGWRIVNALDQKSRDSAGFHGLDGAGKPHNRQESFFLAETLKYLYLLYSDDDHISLKEYVFNTEAHTFSIRGYGRRRDPKDWVPIPKPGQFKAQRKLGSK
eukprot:jgi/Hompol1/2193/HPOL_005882-RA